MTNQTEMTTRQLYKRLREINKDFKFTRFTSDLLNRTNIDISLNGITVNPSIMSEKFYNENKDIMDKLSVLRNELGTVIDSSTGYKIGF